MPRSVTASRVGTRGNVKAPPGLFNIAGPARAQSRGAAPGASPCGGDPPGQVAKVAGHALQLVRGALETREGKRLLLGRRGDRLGARPVAVGDAGDPADAILEAGTFLLLIA